MDKSLRTELLEVFGVHHQRDMHCLNDIYMTVKAKPGPYGDMTPRHLKGIGRKEVAERKDAMFLGVAKAIEKCIEAHYTTQEAYDEWHKETCIALASELEGLCSEGVTVKPGKAQKLINMSMKHIFCFDNAENAALSGAFRFCHMPIDRYVLAWYYREVCPKDKRELNWGNHEYDEYIKIQHNIRNFLADCTRNHEYVDSNGDPLTPFEAEFYIWNEEKLLQSAYSFTAELSNKPDRGRMKSETLRKQLEIIMQMIDSD